MHGSNKECNTEASPEEGTPEETGEEETVFQKASQSQEEGQGEETIPRSIIFQFFVGCIVFIEFIVIEQQWRQASKGRGGRDWVGC